MKFQRQFFNIILLALGLVAGCQSFENTGKELTSLRLHLEVFDDGTTFSTTVPIYRANPVKITVESSSFADERDVELAQVIDWMGGYAIQLNLNRHGQWMLENITRGNLNRRIAVFAQFDKESRWLAAPLISHPIANGEIVFTPDASREETERIVRGLNKVAAELKKKSHF